MKKQKDILNFLTCLSFILTGLVLASCIDPGKTYYIITFDPNGGIENLNSNDPYSGNSYDKYSGKVAVEVGSGITLPYGNDVLSKNGCAFVRWNTNSSGTGTFYDPGQYFTPDSDIILYAVWEKHSSYIIPGSTIENKLNWLNENAVSGGDYIIDVIDDISSNDPWELISSGDPWELSYKNRSQITITLKSSDIRTITASDTYSDPYNRSMFTVSSGVTLKLENIILKSSGRSSNALVSVEGTLIMNVGSYIQDHHSTVVTVSGTFIMNGGEISGNYGGVNIENGTFIMNGGVISGNLSGGVSLFGGTFTMSDGTIRGNTTYDLGGGLYIAYGSFIKTGGTIYGYSNNNNNSNVVKNYGGDVLNGRGHAIYANYGRSSKRKETTSGPGDVLTFNYGDGGKSSWTGSWDN